MRVSEYCVTSLSAQSWQYCDRGKPKDRIMPDLFFKTNTKIMERHLVNMNRRGCHLVKVEQMYTPPSESISGKRMAKMRIKT